MKKILVQFDHDAQASLFDAVVAIDADVDHLLQYPAIEPAAVRDIVHGAIFTRGVDQLQNTAIFIGGSDVVRGEDLLDRVQAAFFGPMRVSVMLDPNGANTTAAAAVLAADKHLELNGCPATVLAATGPVGQRVTRLLAGAGAHVRVCSRSHARADDVVTRLQAAGVERQGGSLQAYQTSSSRELSEALQGTKLVIASGAAGIELLPQKVWQPHPTLELIVDLNAVEPAGVEGLSPTAKAQSLQTLGGPDKNGYGAIGVGGLKMKIHRASIRSLFQSNDTILDADEIFAIGQSLLSAKN